MDNYDQVYDEVFWEISARIREQGYAGKLDLAALVCWKRSGQGAWVEQLLSTPEAAVRAVTRRAFRASTSQVHMDDQARLDELAVLPGFRRKYAIATAVLTASDPEEFGVLDSRAILGLERIACPIDPGRGETLRYLSRLRELRDMVRVRRPDATCRNIDQGLWVIGGE